MNGSWERAIRLSAVLAAVLAGTLGCGGTTPAQDAPAADGAAATTTAAPPTPPPGVVEFEQAEPGSGTGITIGFTQLSLASGFPQDVQKSVEEQAERAGAELITCDSKLDAAKALDCAKLFKTRDVQGLITFQADTNAAPRICAAGPSVPVMAVDITQKPCETSFVGAANTYAGQLIGYELGKYFKEKFDCQYDAFISLEALQVGEVNEQRMGGIRDGFAGVCGEVRNLRKLDAGGAGGDVAQKLVTDTLTALPGQHRIILVGINEDGILGALAAARAQNRTNDLYLGVQNLNPKNCVIYQHPNWIGSVAYFPERYGEILVPNLIKAIKGEKVAPQLLVPHVVINKANIKQHYPQYAC
ncbi:ribose transport system substrate-binding protein [Thermocatellispora tengchongensis]|uniref:Ribose transport system substrate-binding protein n=1 Tax=Thermocatellispora tengchongensis TaxID=1073253 RepID=A0A840P528_9ACTN|nr:sugar ABC transporter substrate-binding protein [Thermocatellispora tengchongensis]MBB5134452.1 ribose transport system substrate-binding protein [Thermocatellispora tengchongensis]